MAFRYRYVKLAAFVESDIASHTVPFYARGTQLQIFLNTLFISVA